MATTNKIFLGIDDKVIELTGADKDAFIAQREADNVQISLLETKYKEKQETKNLAIKKLADVAGLTEDELKAVLNG